MAGWTATGRGAVIIAGDSKINDICFLACWQMPQCESQEKSPRLVRVFLLLWRLQSVYSGKILDPPSVRYNYLELTLCRSVTPPSTLYQHLLAWAGEAREALRILFASDRSARLHWVDNYAKSYASRSMFSNRSLFKSCLWTAHGFKKLPPTMSADWIMDDTKTPVPAMPHLDELFTPGRMDELIVDLFGLARNYFDRSLTVTENVTRIPVKVGEQQL